MPEILEKPNRIMSLDDIRALTQDDMAKVNERIKLRLSSEVELINQLGAYIVNSGGKRLRPLLVLLSANACGYRGTHHHDLAAIVEFIHTATLLHDDVVDASDLRRGRETANAIWGNEAAVLVGDFLYSRAFEMMVEVGSMRIMQIMAKTTNTIAEGEVMQLLNCNDPDTSEDSYMEVIRSKTAKLFEAAAQIGAVLGKQSTEIEQTMARFGMHIGTAFQLIDDVLDYSASSADMGKNIGDDLAEGKPTLPLIHAMRNGTEPQRQLIRAAIEQGGLDQIDAVLTAIKETGAIEYTADIARKAATDAMECLDPLPTSSYKDALYALTDFAVSRSY